MNWLHYLLEANLYLCVFYAGYCLFLNKETYYTLNRVYLLFSCVISFVLPMLQIGALKPADTGAITLVLLPKTGVNQFAATPVHAAANPLTFQDVLLYAYLLGAIVTAIVLLFRLIQLSKMTKTTNQLVDGKYKMISIDNSNIAFSFFNYLFIGTKTAGTDIIIRHELVHMRQKHSADIVFMELIKIFNWFNPLIYLLQMSLKTVHEYIADEQTAALEPDALSYSSFLVNNAYGLNGLPITHSFFNYNLLKKRIIMLNQKRSGNLARLKYLMALPICGALLCASTLGFSKTYGWVDLAPKHTTTQSSHVPIADVAIVPAKNADTAARTTSKGYKYQETGYLIKGKTNYRVIITEKNGEEKAYFKNTATAADIKLLRNKYGYQFPSMAIYAKLPPPPPAPMAAPQSID
ncbi:M56 family metallopeptidase [Mucilaginibacter sp.]|uniref:M56 family metallopeptidase n=1 Tax=Mucilaginibacter sp. TaxID=1882438 RepID=UPI003D0F5D28